MRELQMALCLSCLGQKKIQGMGFMGEVDCRTCKGTGVAPVTVEIVEPGVEQEVSMLEIKDESIRHPQLSEGECFSKATTHEEAMAKLIKQNNIDAFAKLEKTEDLELVVETHESGGAAWLSTQPKSEPQTLAEKFKRKYTKSAK